MGKPKLASVKECTACMACIDACAHKALKWYYNKRSELSIGLDSDLCVECGACSKVCPIVSKYNYESLNLSQPYAAWSTDDTIRNNSASGGVFSALARTVLINGGCVCGAYLDGLEVRHIMVDKEEELIKLQNSKYQQSIADGIYQRVRSELNKGRMVLFSGAPCQVAALFSFLHEKKYDNLYTLDFICTGFASRIALDKYCKVHPNIKTVKYRHKEKGWGNGDQNFLYIKNNSDILKDRYNLPCLGFFSYMIHRNSCLECKFAKLNRKSDYTVADFWGDKDYLEQHFKGLSMLSVNTKQGYNLLHDSSLELHKTSWNKVLPINYRMVIGNHFYYKYHPARLFSLFCFEHFSVATLTHILGYETIRKHELLWLPYKIFCICFEKISMYRKHRQAIKFLK